jgi:hemoglobin/transferrin/lactoferrin receptor protein
MKATYSFSKFLHVSAGLENIFDERYRPYSSGITAPGRNAILAVRVKV